LTGVSLPIMLGNIVFTNSVRTEWIETDATQEHVLATLKSHSEKIEAIRGNTDNRWRSTEEMAYQSAQRQIMDDHKEFQFERDRVQDLGINAMKEMHIFGHYRMYNERSHDH